MPADSSPPGKWTPQIARTGDGRVGKGKGAQGAKVGGVEHRLNIVVVDSCRLHGNVPEVKVVPERRIGGLFGGHGDGGSDGRGGNG